MATNIEYKWNGQRTEIVADKSWSPDTVDFHLLHNQLFALNLVVPLAILSMKKRPDGDYDYRFDTKDSRVWSQVVRIDPVDPLLLTSMKFSVSDFFLLSEFEPNRVLRASIIRLTNRYGISRLEITWS